MEKKDVVVMVIDTDAGHSIMLYKNDCRGVYTTDVDGVDELHELYYNLVSERLYRYNPFDGCYESVPSYFYKVRYEVL